MMAIILGQLDQAALTVSIDRILSDYGSGGTTAKDVREVFTYIINAAARGDERELRGWLQPETIDLWEMGF